MPSGELKLSKVAIQGFTLFEVGALVGTLLWGWLSDLANGRRALVACVALALIIATLGVYQHASNSMSIWLRCLRWSFLVFGPQLLIGVAAVGFVPKKAIGAADGIKGTFAYLIGDSFSPAGSWGMICRRHAHFSASPVGRAPLPRWIPPPLAVSA
jgi:OPA family hexose phosphate transport protein UhpT-like MFS transporter